MKNLMTEIKKCENKKYARTYVVQASDCDARGRLNVWILLNLIEQLQAEPATCLSKIAPHYKKDLEEVTLRLYEDARAGDTLELEARFYEVDRRKVELKIFVRKIQPDKTTKRVCRAGYAFRALFNEQAA
jgi:uncharacterized protein (DUF2461 family)